MIAHRCRSPSLVIAMWLLGVVPKAMPAAPTQHFHAEGEITITLREAQRPKSEGFHFSVFVDGERWLIRTQPHAFLTNSSAAPIEYFETGTDGLDLFALSQFNEAYDRRRGQKEALGKLQEQEQELARLRTNPEGLQRVRELIANITADLNRSDLGLSGSNGAAGDVTRGTIPSYRPHDLIAPLWLAFCSSAWFAAQHTNIVPALFENISPTLTSASNVFMRGSYTLMDAPSRLPVDIAFLNDGIFFLAPRSQVPAKVFQQLITRRASPRVTVEYKVAQLKTYDGLTLPQQFSYDLYDVSKDGSVANTVTTCRIVGSTTGAGAYFTLDSFAPKVSVDTAVADHRFIEEQAIPGVPYLIQKGGTWPSMNDVRPSQEYRRGRSTAQRNPANAASSWSFQKVAAWVLLLLSLTLPPAVHYWGRRTIPRQKYAHKEHN